MVSSTMMASWMNITYVVIAIFIILAILVIWWAVSPKEGDPRK